LKVNKNPEREGTRSMEQRTKERTSNFPTGKNEPSIGTREGDQKGAKWEKDGKSTKKKIESDKGKL